MEIYKNLSLEDLPNEEWRDVVGFEGLYQVSNLGRVKSCGRTVLVSNKRCKEGYLKTYRAIIMSQNEDDGGYLILCLYAPDKKTFVKKVHRLVAEAFCGALEGLQVDHIDCNRKNNTADNLRICTPKENVNNPITRERRRISSIGNTAKTRQPCQYKLNICGNKFPIVKLSMDNNLLGIYDSAIDVQKEFGFHSGYLAACCKGKYKTAYGFKWMYKLDYDKVNTK